MNQYHATLILQNLTTNEHMNKHRYHYLRNDLGQYHNAFSKGSYGNCIEFCQRGNTVRGDPYIHSSIYQGLTKGGDMEVGGLTDGASSTDGSEYGDEGELLSHSHTHKHSHH